MYMVLSRRGFCILNKKHHVKQECWDWVLSTGALPTERDSSRKEQAHVLGLGWTEVRSPKLHPSLHMNDRDSSTGLTACCLPDVHYIRKLNQKQTQDSIAGTPIYGVAVLNGNLSHYTTLPTLKLVIFMVATEKNSKQTKKVVPFSVSHKLDFFAVKQ